MESNSPPRIPNGSVGVDGHSPDPPLANGDGQPKPDGKAAVEPAPHRPEPLNAAENVWRRLRQRYAPQSDGANLQSMGLAEAAWRRVREQTAPLIQQATGRPLSPAEVSRSLRSGDLPQSTPLKIADDRDAGYSTVLVARDDPLPTICGKLDAAALPEVAVVVPRGNTELSTAVGMRLLMRHADWAGKEIVLVTRRQTLRQLAHAEGLRYVGSPQRLPFGRRSRTQTLIPGLDLPVPAASTIAWLAGAGIALLIAVIAIFWFLPSATITLFPTTTPISQEESLQLDPLANHVDTVNDVVPADRRSITVTRTVFLPVTGSASVEQTSGDPVDVPAVADADVKAAQDLANAALTDQAVQDFQHRDGDAWEYFPQTAKVDVQSVDPAQKTGAASPFLQVTYRGSVSMLAAKQSDLRALLLSNLRTKVPAGRQVIDSSERLTVEKSGPYDVPGDRLPLLLRLDAATASHVDMGKIEHALRGKSKRAAVEYAAKAIDGVHAPALKLSPGWMPWLPRFAGRVHVELSAQK